MISLFLHKVDQLAPIKLSELQGLNILSESLFDISLYIPFSAPFRCFFEKFFVTGFFCTFMSHTEIH